MTSTKLFKGLYDPQKSLLANVLIIIFEWFFTFMLGLFLGIILTSVITINGVAVTTFTDVRHCLQALNDSLVAPFTFTNQQPCFLTFLLFMFSFIGFVCLIITLSCVNSPSRIVFHGNITAAAKTSHLKTLKAKSISFAYKDQEASTSKSSKYRR